MKFRKGVKVEVLQKAEAPFGSWRPATIVSGNGHTYLVSYDERPFDGGVDVERIPRKALRPSPPPSDGQVCWVPGDILEVFDSYSWKVAEVVRLLGQEFYLVRLLGSSQEMRVHTSNLRARQLWQDGDWVALPKDSARCAGGSLRSRTKGGNSGGSHLLLKDKVVLEGNMSRGIKRKSSAASAFPMQRSEVTKKFQTSHRDGRRQYLGPGDSLRLMDKVDAVDSPCLMLGEKCMHDSLNNRANGFPKTNLAAVNTYVDYQYPAVTTQDRDTDSAASSVGSCSPYGSPYRPAHPQEYDSEDICSRNDDNDDEASTSGRESPLPMEGGLKEETHLLELHAYRATMMALYAYGSISWEQEALMTNLRLTLNISTDEHLSELRNLAFSSVCSR
ncbi:uncharacterized protein LOC124691967 isoform X1 [Lolium rigidum]|uniref:uncharacterized protein LOC124691959 isoform X1 n=1 Tax=Lolium rigidum TaxID=89674 RepID=UPI001F5C8177|nr:uncharacterized protein LOC124691959 isoform X1 [Lolium rigidum]XP_047081222.1 uncharacterized protein LOC124691967 isoform X1 [Lolium rigidum]